VLFDAVQLPEEMQATAAAECNEQPVEAKPRRTSRGRGRRVFPDFLSRSAVHHHLNEEEIPEELRNDPAAKRFFKMTGEILEYEPPKLHVVEHYQEVIARDEPTGQTTMITAPKPAPLIDAFAGPGLLAHLTASRFADHLPYYRQEDILSRCGFRIERSTQCRWMSALAERLRPLVDLMRRRALRSLVLGVDETPVRMLSLAPAGSVKAYLWGAVGDRGHPYDCFYFTVDRARAGPEAFLSGFRGYLQSDAYVCYERIALESEEILKVGCWAHARRKFEEVHFTAASVRTHTAMGYFGRLYDIEDRARPLSDGERYELRQQEVRPIVSSFHEWLREHSERELPKSKLRSAVGYMLNRWDAFERYLEHGAIPIDNNRTRGYSLATNEEAKRRLRCSLSRRAAIGIGSTPLRICETCTLVGPRCARVNGKRCCLTAGSKRIPSIGSRSESLKHTSAPSANGNGGPSAVMPWEDRRGRCQ
jgi:transposase